MAPSLGYKVLTPADFLHDGELGETVLWSQHNTDGMPTGAMIYVHWVWLPSVPVEVQYEANLQQVVKDTESSRPQYRDVRIVDSTQGYAWDGPAFWFKEVDKAAPDEIHRWHLKAFGNESQYIVGLTGDFEQFEELGALYEEVIRSFERIPLPMK